MQTRWLWSLVAVSSLLACSDAASGRTGSVSPTGTGAGGAGAGGSAGVSGTSGHPGAGQGGSSGSSGHPGAGQAGLSGSSGYAGTSPAGGSGAGGAATGGAPGLCEAGPAPSKGACTKDASFPYLCNPFTADTCDPGQECTLATWDYDYECTGHFGDLPLCAPCDENTQYQDSTKTCAAGSWCFESTCQRLCCDDGDCATGHCQLVTGYPHNNIVGFCKLD